MGGRCADLREENLDSWRRVPGRVQCVLIVPAREERPSITMKEGRWGGDLRILSYSQESLRGPSGGFLLYFGH